MPTGSTRGDVHFVDLAEILFADLHLLEKYFARVLRDASQSGIADRARLLINFLEHEMLKAALLCLNRVPGNTLDLALNRLGVKIRELDAGRSDHRQIAIG